MKRMVNLTHQKLLEVLDYDPATGFFVWKVAKSNRVRVGSRAGVTHEQSGGRYISIDGEKFMAHRLAWFYAYGQLPEQDIRPADGNYDNCALANLKEISRVALQHSRGKQANNTSGFPGVSSAPHNKWQARVTWNYQQISLGMNFALANEAAEVVQDALSRLRACGTQDEVNETIEHLRVEKRQRAVWAYLLRGSDAFTWKTFAEFSGDVKDVQEHRYAMAPIDATKPMGLGNYRWASSGHAKTTTTEGKVQYARDNRRTNPDRERDRRFKKEYGIDFARYQGMLLAQKGVCAICEKPETKMQNGAIRMLSVDHNHTTGEVRGLLCANCNLAIGYACDSVEVLEQAIGYLQKHDRGNNVVPFGEEAG